MKLEQDARTESQIRILRAADASSRLPSANRMWWFMEQGTTLVEHIGPAPPAGRHRYIFCLFKQKDETKVEIDTRERPKWDFRAFLTRNP